MPYELPQDPATERRTRISRWVTFGFAFLLLGLVIYFAYIGYEGSRQLTDAPTDTSDCRTPAAFDWDYEAINYDIATDDVLASEPDPEACAAQGAPPGDLLAGPGDIRLAGWYIPASSAIGPTGPTVILAHGWSSNKSNMLDRAALLHDDYNLVLFDFRNHGQSELAPTTQGVREAGDLEAVVDWLEAAKGPERIALFGVSMGGASVLNEADSDPRIAAVIVESTHATIASAVQARLDAGGYPSRCREAGRSSSARSRGPARTSAPPTRCRPSSGSTSGQCSSSRAAGTSSIGAERRRRAAWLPRPRPARRPALRCVPRPPTPSRTKPAPRSTRAWVLGFLERVLAPAG